MAGSDSDVARLLSEYSHKPPKLHLSAEDKKDLAEIVIKSRKFRILKDKVRVTAWEQFVAVGNGDPRNPDFPVDFARAQGYRDGMLAAINFLETFVEEDGDDDREE